jgi:F-type H+-transporting ATPase subunit delta
MRISEVSRRYARALYELAKTNQSSEIVFSELRLLKALFETDPVIHRFVTSPLVAPEQKLAAIRATFTNKTCAEITNILLLLAQKNRLGIFSDLVVAFEEIIDADHGVTRGTVRSAVTLSPESRKKIEDTVTKVTGKKVILNFTEDQSLLGGMVAQVGGWTFDDSLDSHLIRMSEDLNRRAN